MHRKSNIKLFRLLLILTFLTVNSVPNISAVGSFTVKSSTTCILLHVLKRSHPPSASTKMLETQSWKRYFNRKETFLAPMKDNLIPLKAETSSNSHSRSDVTRSI
jgi:hypothetical protein